eukprot:6200299-Pleurochrysis_carterae.AAC.2
MDVSTSAMNVLANETRVSGEKSMAPIVFISSYRCLRSSHSCIQSNGQKRAIRRITNALIGHTCTTNVAGAAGCNANGPTSSGIEVRAPVPREVAMGQHARACCPRYAC